MELNKFDRTFIVAELGINHNGSLDTIYEMIEVAKNCDADAVKLQYMTGYDLVRPDLLFAYKENSKIIEKKLAEMFHANRVHRDWLEPIYNFAKTKDIILFSTPFSKDGIEELEKVDNPIYKISSGDITHTPLIEKAAATGKPVIISTGKSEVEDIRRALKAAQNTSNSQISLMHCVSVYPTPPEELNLKVIQTLSKMFNVPVGFSDHSEGYFSSVLAVAMGAKIIEKHFTLDKSLPGPDHWFSLDPAEFTQLVQTIRKAEEMFGNGEKNIGDNEKKVNERASRSIVLNRDAIAGETLKESDLDFKRPGDGLRPYELNRIIGRTLKVSKFKDNLIKYEDLE